MSWFTWCLLPVAVAFATLAAIGFFCRFEGLTWSQSRDRMTWYLIAALIFLTAFGAVVTWDIPASMNWVTCLLIFGAAACGTLVAMSLLSRRDNVSGRPLQYLSLFLLAAIVWNSLQATELFLINADLVLFVLGCVVLSGVVRLQFCEAYRVVEPKFQTERESKVLSRLAVVAALAFCLLCAAFLKNSTPDWVLFYERAAHSLNGVSLWSGSLLLAACFYLLALQQGEGLLLDGDGPPPDPPWSLDPKLKTDDPNWTKAVTVELRRSRNQLLALLGTPMRELWLEHQSTCMVLGGLSVLWVGMLVTKITPQMYDGFWSCVYWLILTSFFVIWVLWAYSVLCYLKELQRFLDHMTSLPILDSFKRLPDALAPFFGRVLFRISHMRTTDRRIAMTYLNTIKERRDPIGDATKDFLTDPKTNWNSAFALEMSGKKNACRDALNEVARTLWETKLTDAWQDRSPDRAFAIGEGQRSGDDSRKERPPLATLNLADDFILVQLISYCNPLLRHAWRSCWCVAVSALLFLLAIASYGAQPQGFFGTTAVGMIIALGLLTGWLVWETERSEFLSRFAGTTPGKVQFDWSFVIQLVVLFLIPVLVIINVAFPGSFDWLGTLFAPLLHVMK